MAGILANSVAATMVAGDTAVDNTATGYLTNEQVTLTVTDVDPASISWGISIPSASAVARSGLDDDDVETVHYTPDVGGYYTVTANVDGTIYVLRMSVVAVAQTTAEGVIGLQPLTDAQAPTPAAGENLYYSSTGSALAVKDTAGTVSTVVTSTTPIAGATASRPSLPRVGESWFDTDLNYPVWWDGTAWAGVSVGAEYGELYWSTPALTELDPDTWAKAAGTTTLGISNEFSMPANNRLRHDDADTEIYKVSCDYTITCAGNNKTVWVGLSKNGATPDAATQRYRLIATGADAGMGATHGLFSLASADYVELHVKSTDGSDVTVERGAISAVKVG